MTIHRDVANGRTEDDLQRACIEAALRRYEEAKISGLCHEGAWEIAVDTLRKLSFEERAIAERILKDKIVE